MTKVHNHHKISKCAEKTIQKSTNAASFWATAINFAAAAGVGTLALKSLLSKPEPKSNSVFELPKNQDPKVPPQNTVPGSDFKPVDTTTVQNFNDWTFDVIQKELKNEPTSIFNMFSQDRVDTYNAAVSAKNNDEAKKIYGEGALISADTYIKSIDKNNDGVVDETEYKEQDIDMAKKLGIEFQEDENTGAIFKSMDLNGDGKIDSKEQAAAFAYMDMDKKGTLDAKFSADDLKIFTSQLTSTDAQGNANQKLRNDTIDGLKGMYGLLFGTQER